MVDKKTKSTGVGEKANGKKSSVKAEGAKEPASTSVKKNVSRKTSANKVGSGSSRSDSKGRLDTAITQAKTVTPKSKVAQLTPTPPESLEMAARAMNCFIKAKENRSMASFYDEIALAWQKITSVEKLNEAFSVVINDPASWNFLLNISPSLLKAELTDRGDWLVMGVYPTKPKRLIFDQIYINENNTWKLAELKLYTADA